MGGHRVTGRDAARWRLPWPGARRKSSSSGAQALAAILRQSAGGTVATPERAAAMPAALSAIRILAETAAMLPLHVYKRTADGRERADAKDPLERLLTRAPAPGLSPMDWRSDVMASCVGFGNAYLRKVRGTGGVRWLVMLDPRTVTAKWADDGLSIVYTVAGDGGGAQLTSQEILHIRGFTLHGEAEGLSPVGVCRRALTAGVNLETFLERFVANNAAPGGVLEFPGTVTHEKAQEILEIWNASQTGENAGRTAVLGGGATWRAVGMSMVDAQFMESQRFSIEQVARIFNMPASFLLGKATRDDYEWFLKFGLGPWLARVDSRLSTDDDLCPVDGGAYVEHTADALLKPASRERMAAYKDARQGGWITANEIRRMENLPSVDGGDEIQQTPVGGAPNAPGSGQPVGGEGDANSDET